MKELKYLKFPLTDEYFPMRAIYQLGEAFGDKLVWYDIYEGELTLRKYDDYVGISLDGCRMIPYGGLVSGTNIYTRYPEHGLAGCYGEHILRIIFKFSD